MEEVDKAAEAAKAAREPAKGEEVRVPSRGRPFRPLRPLVGASTNSPTYRDKRKNHFYMKKSEQ
jgi:hypothetical protein